MFRISSALLLQLSSVLVLSTPGRAAFGAESLEAADRELAVAQSQARKAREAYGLAFAVWSDVARETGSTLPDVERRSLEARASLASLSLDVRTYRTIVKEGAVAPWRPTVRSGKEPETAEIARLVGIISKAIARFPRSGPDAELRDLALLAETLALLHQVRGDIDQRRADDGFRRVLELVRTSGAPPEERAAREISARFHLREFRAAVETAGPANAIVPLPDGKRCETLALLENACVFLGESGEEKAYRALREEVCRKEWESPRVSGRFGRNLIGSRADLLFVVQSFHELEGLLDLPPRAIAVSRYIAARSAIELGEYALAEELLRGTDRFVEGDAWLRASMAARLSWLRDRLGDYEAAYEALRVAREAASKLANADEFRTRLDLHEARIELGLGKLEEAVETAAGLLRNPAAAPGARIGARLTAASALLQLAALDGARLEDARRALLAAERDLRDAPEFAEKAEYAILAAVQLGNVSRLEALRAAEPERIAELRAEAMERQDRAMRDAHEHKLYELSAVAAGNLGELRLEAKDAAGARAVVEWALARARENQRLETEWRCHWYLGRIADLEKDPVRAGEEYRLALEIVERGRDRILDADAKAGFMTDKMDLFRQLVDRALRQGQPAAALDLAERGRARALVESLGWRFVALAGKRDSELYREYISLVARTARSHEGPAPRFFGGEAATEDYDALRKRLQEVREEILGSEATSRALKALVDGAPIRCGEILARLGDTRTLVEYFDLGESFVAFVAGKGEVQAVRLPAGSAELRIAVDRFVRGAAADVALGRKLHAWLLEPVESLVRTEEVVVVPYGVLHGLPFEALRRPRGFQIEAWEISYLPSASVLAFLDFRRRAVEGPPSGRPERPRHRLLALADPLTDYDGDGRYDKVPLAGARTEVESFSKSFVDPQVYYGEKAGESLLRRSRREADVLHLACHGEFHRARPWESTLFLAPEGADPDSDGRLRAWEVYGLDLRGLELVALSGCETGVEDVAAGDDPAGLATAFLHGGATSLLVSLWKVEDRATADLMRRFYRAWIDEDRPRAAALREAKLALLEEGRDRPAEWASFVLVGAW